MTPNNPLLIPHHAEPYKLVKFIQHIPGSGASWYEVEYPDGRREPKIIPPKEPRRR